MQRRQFLVLVLTAFISVLGVGCGEKSPKEVVKDFYYSVCEGDIDKALNYLTLRSQQLLDSSLMLMGKKGGTRGYLEEFSKNCKKLGGLKEIKVETQKISDSEVKWSALVVYGNGKKVSDEGYLTKTDKGWKIDIKK
jgi:hypothetical protein